MCIITNKLGIAIIFTIKLKSSKKKWKPNHAPNKNNNKREQKIIYPTVIKQWEVLVLLNKIGVMHPAAPMIASKIILQYFIQVHFHEANFRTTSFLEKGCM